MSKGRLRWASLTRCGLRRIHCEVLLPVLHEIAAFIVYPGCVAAASVRERAAGVQRARQDFP